MIHKLEIVALNILNKRLDFVLVEFFQTLRNDSIFIILQLLCLLFRVINPPAYPHFPQEYNKKKLVVDMVDMHALNGINIKNINPSNNNPFKYASVQNKKQ